jgi:hypothetical protein
MSSRSKFFDGMMEDFMLSKEDAKALVKTDLEKFVFNLQYGKEFEVEYNVRDEFEKIFNKYCKSSGQSDTQMGELLRGLMKLCYRYENDGDEIEVGSYSGIWYGLRENLECPFIACDYGVDWWNCRFDCFNTSISHGMGRDYVRNIALNALILETFADEYDWSPRIDIADYYENIVNFLVNKDIVKKFEDNGLNITHNFGAYSYPNFNSGYISEFEINSITEDMYITIPLRSNEFTIKYFGSMNCKFELTFDWNYVDTIFAKYGDLLRFLLHLATVDYKKHIDADVIKDDLKNIGFEVKDGYITKQY